MYLYLQRLDVHVPMHLLGLEFRPPQVARSGRRERVPKSSKSSAVITRKHDWRLQSTLQERKLRHLTWYGQRMMLAGALWTRSESLSLPANLSWWKPCPVRFQLDLGKHGERVSSRLLLYSVSMSVLVLYDGFDN